MSILAVIATGMIILEILSLVAVLVLLALVIIDWLWGRRNERFDQKHGNAN